MSNISTSPYELCREIGRGAYGTVYLAKGPSGFVALKICCKPENGDDALFQRERRGVKTYFRIPRHPHLIRLFDFVEDPDGTWFYTVMELADPETARGGIDMGSYRPKTLAGILSAEIALPLRECIDLAIGLANALQHLQRHHLAHRDIKPGNILIVHGKPVLADIGLMADVREAPSIVGTPGYCSPEHDVTPQWDVFSMGQTLYRMSTGRNVDEHGFSPCAEADTESPFFWRWMMIVDKACSRTPSRRYRSAKALERDLRKLRFQNRLYRSRHVKRLLLLGGIALCIWLIPDLPMFLIWRSHSPETRYEYRPMVQGPYRILIPLFSPSKDAEGNRYKTLDEQLEPIHEEVESMTDSILSDLFEGMEETNGDGDSGEQEEGK